MSPRPYWKGYLKLLLAFCPIAGWRVVAWPAIADDPRIRIYEVTVQHFCVARGAGNPAGDAHRLA